MSKKEKITIPAIEKVLPLEITAEIEQLSILLKAIKGNCIVFAVYHAIADRELVVEQLKKRLTYPIQELFFSKKRKDVIGLLTSLDGKHQLKNQVIFLYDLEKTFPESLGNLNLQREMLAEIHHPLVFWIREFALREIAEQAPDFWAWRSEVFDFRLEQAELAAPTVQGYLGETGFYHKTREDLDRRISLFQEILERNEREATPDKNLIAYLSDKLAEMCYYLSDLNLAWQYWERSLNIYQESGDRAGLARSYGNQALILKTGGKLDDAMKFHKKVEEIFSELRDRAGLAACYCNQAGIFYSKGDFKTAFDLYKKQEEISSEIGNRYQISQSYAGQALILKAWGKLDDAMALLQKQEQICVELGDRAGLARCFCNQALCIDSLDKIKTANILFKKAETILSELKNNPGLAEFYWEQGKWRGRIAHDHDRQIELWKKSIEIKKEIGIPTAEDEKALAEL